jgi:hypothetical protein
LDKDHDELREGGDFGLAVGVPRVVRVKVFAAGGEGEAGIDVFEAGLGKRRRDRSVKDLIAGSSVSRPTLRSVMTAWKEGTMIS